MAEYVWELGIDWNATEPTGVGYLRGGLAKKDSDTNEFKPVSGTSPVTGGDSITFRVFDMTSSPPPEPPGKWVNAIPYFRIFSQAAVKDQLIDKGLSDLQPKLTQDNSPEISVCFPTDHVSASWTSRTPVSVVSVVSEEDHAWRFLLTVNVQATGTDGSTRFFRHDPEMVVGGTGG